MRKLALALVGLCAVAANATDASNGPRRVRFTTDEGTWISLDVSPDTRHIVFDLVGDLYELPFAGGHARRLTSGTAFDVQPRYSPDGRSIVFVSDRSGADNVWLMDVASGALRPLTRDTGAFFVSPAWTPDGEHVVVSRSTKSTGHGREYQLFVYPKGGDGGARQLTGAGAGAGAGAGVDADAQFSAETDSGSPMIFGAAFGADPQRLYVSMEVPARWPISGDWQIGVGKLADGHFESFTQELNGAMRPVLSPDGRYIVYATRWANRARLKLLDLHSREARWLGPDIDRDATDETAPRRDLSPGASFTSDSRTLVIAHHGKIWRVAVPDGSAIPVPFTADVDVQLAPLAQFNYPIDGHGVTARRIEQPQLSPDGHWLAFSALDRIWIQAMDSGTPGSRASTAPRQFTPRQLSKGGDGAFFPAWSPDSRYLAYVTWNDLQGGGIWRVSLEGDPVPEKLSAGRDFYEKLAYAADGKRLVAARTPFEDRYAFFGETQGIGRADTREWVWLPADGGADTFITYINAVTEWGASSHYGLPHFVDGDIEHLYFTDPVDGLIRVRWDGSQRRSILRVEGPGFAKAALASEMLLSPDGRRVLALLDNQVWLLDRPVKNGAAPTVTLSSDSAQSTARRLSRDGADFPRWRVDGQSVSWSLGSTIFTQAVQDGPAKEPQRQDVLIRIPRDTPRGALVLRGARVITMRADEVIENADVVIVDDRIESVGVRGSVRIPHGARILDVTGKTILPGFVDIHWHGGPPWGVHRQQVWEFQSTLAYGVTSIRDPQPSTMDALTYADRIAIGEVLGPRFFTTGTGVFESEGIRSLQDARSLARRYARFYRTETLKDYMTNADRQTHQWLMDAAREYRLTPTAEGNSDFKYSLTRIFDGYGGQEHMATAATYHQDLVRLFAASGTTVTPTLLQGQSGGEDRLKQFVNSHDLRGDAKARRFFPAEEIEYLSENARSGPLEARYPSQELASQAIALLAAGGRVALGVHGAIEGIGAHWALWTFVDGGMRPHDALRVGTLMGAEAIGHGRDFGSIEHGKLADLQVLDGNPLEDIRQTLSLRYVAINGRLYDASTLDQVWPEPRKLGRQWWQAKDADGPAGRVLAPNAER